MPKLSSHGPSRTSYRNTSFPSESFVAVTCRFWTFSWTADRLVSSWKCVAKRQYARIFVTMCSEIAYARPKPSYVDVPRPSSSMITSDLEVALLRIAAVSSISAINVETPRSWLSPAPTRARILSVIGMSALWAGTKHPIWAINAMTPAILMYVDFPPMLGPVMIDIAAPSRSIFATNLISLEMKGFPSKDSSTIGCLLASILRPFPGARIVGLVYISGASAATHANETSTSNSATETAQSSNTSR
mmetsp:Transcript_13681/g.19746  ORF Transcript_13681/g.19746 Transcript_13681/m.19746 type:complete len:246 (-) Transcript_13681:1939-2676(-)